MPSKFTRSDAIAAAAGVARSRRGLSDFSFEVHVRYRSFGASGTARTVSLAPTPSAFAA